MLTLKRCATSDLTGSTRWIFFMWNLTLWGVSSKFDSNQDVFVCLFFDRELQWLLTASILDLEEGNTRKYYFIHNLSLPCNLK